MTSKKVHSLMNGRLEENLCIVVLAFGVTVQHWFMKAVPVEDPIGEKDVI